LYSNQFKSFKYNWTPRHYLSVAVMKVNDWLRVVMCEMVLAMPGLQMCLRPPKQDTFIKLSAQTRSWRATVLQRLIPNCLNTLAWKFLVCLRHWLAVQVCLIGVEPKLCRTVALQEQNWTPLLLAYRLIKTFVSFAIKKIGNILTNILHTIDGYLYWLVLLMSIFARVCTSPW